MSWSSEAATLAALSCQFCCLDAIALLLKLFLTIIACGFLSLFSVSFKLNLVPKYNQYIYMLREHFTVEWIIWTCVRVIRGGCVSLGDWHVRNLGRMWTRGLTRYAVQFKKNCNTCRSIGKIFSAASVLRDNSSELIW